MKMLIFAATMLAVATLVACSSGSSNNGTPAGQYCVNGTCYNSSQCGVNGSMGPYVWNQQTATCMDTLHNIPAPPAACNNGLTANVGYNSYLNNGVNNSIYSPYCNQYPNGVQPYYNPAGMYPYNGVCGGAMQVYDPRTGASNCVPWGMYNQYAPYAQPTMYPSTGGSLWFYLWI